MGMHPWFKFGLAGLKTFRVISRKNSVTYGRREGRKQLNWPVTLKYGPRSPILELGQGAMLMHPWFKFGLAGLKICWVISQTSQTG